MNNKSIINMMTCHTKRLFLLFVLGITYAVSTLAAQWHTENGLKFLIDTKNITATLSQETYTGDIVIPEKVTVSGIGYPVVALGDNCFKNCKITSVSIPSTVKELGISCFNSCTSLPYIELPDGITELPDSCFKSANLKNGIKLPQKLQKIKNYCFYNCSFSQISLPSSLVEFGNSAFSYCRNLASIEIPDNIKKINHACFSNCYNLSKIKFPHSLEILEDCCFDNCRSLESVTLPPTLINMGGKYGYLGCFARCSKLKEITLPHSLTYIASNTFDDCPNLQFINCYATEPPTLGKDVFSSDILASCILNVPEESETKYKEAGASTTGYSAWKDFKNIYTLDTPEPSVDVLTANITDAETNIPEGTYYAGNLTYTRTGEYVKAGKYVAQCLPFDINLAETKCFTDVFIPMDIALYNTNTKLLTLMIDKADMTSVIKAGQPFIAKLAEDKVEVKNCNSTYISENYTAQEIETEFKVYDTTGQSGVLQRNYNLDVRLGGTYQYKDGLDDNVYKTFMSTGQFGGSDHVLPFRAYVYKANAAAQAAVQSISWGIGDETTGIKYIVTPETKVKDNKVFTLDGKLVNQTGDTKSLKKGIYIINGRKIIIK